MKLQEIQVKDQAKKAVNYFNNGGRKRGGNKSIRKANSFGIALKYVFALRDMTYADVANKLNITPQAINNIVNRMNKNRFDEFYVNKLCRILSIDSAYFYDLVEEIDNIMEV